jgi:signal transduction histidine kinase
VVVTVADEGPGLDAEAQRTLFEPFSTTKPKGTGLGLYVSHEIVKSHGGSLTVRSTAGSGATFAVELPLDHTGGTR